MDDSMRVTSLEKIYIFGRGAAKINFLFRRYVDRRCFAFRFWKIEKLAIKISIKRLLWLVLLLV